jgi:hypothetical protein
VGGQQNRKKKEIPLVNGAVALEMSCTAYPSASAAVPLALVERATLLAGVMVQADSLERRGVGENGAVVPAPVPAG